MGMNVKLKKNNYKKWLIDIKTGQTKYKYFFILSTKVVPIDYNTTFFLCQKLYVEHEVDM